MLATEQVSVVQAMEQDLDCWVSLRKLIKSNGSRFFKQVLRTRKSKNGLTGRMKLGI